MKQALQSLSTGTISLTDVPAPLVRPKSVLIATRCSLVSAGTERMLLEFGKANWLMKARQQPDKVRDVLNKMRTEGVLTTMEAVRSKLDQPLELGYCNVGTVIETGAGVDTFEKGQRVVSNGGHAQLVHVGRNLCAAVPDAVDDETASFTVLAAIGLQGVRLAQPTIGECVVVTGLGLIGLLTAQILLAQGCRVLGIDPDPARRAMAEGFGCTTVSSSDADDVLAAAAAFSDNHGVDAVLITASTKSSVPVSQAAHMCRKRGRIVLVGVTGLELSRADFYEKELTFQVSCSYGPGRYDPLYEEAGQDYPRAFVRWTEQRNFQAVLDLMASGRIDCTPLISHRFDLAAAEEAFDVLTNGTQSMGIILHYPKTDEETLTQRIIPVSEPAKSSDLIQTEVKVAEPKVVVLGAGNYASRVLIPALRSTGAELSTLVSAGGTSAAHVGCKLGFRVAATDSKAALSDPETNTVVIATRHDQHAAQVLAALEAGKHVFCEKPLCLTEDELDSIEAAAAAVPGSRIMVGFNRRFAPMVRDIETCLANRCAPASFIFTVNAGAIPADHWSQNPAVGGGRIIGEACHFIDLMRHLAKSAITRVSVQSAPPESGVALPDTCDISLSFADGSHGVVHYYANGHKGFAKERIEVFSGGRVMQMDNYLRLKSWGGPNLRNRRAWRQDKGQTACLQAFMDAIRCGAPAPIPLPELIETTRASLRATALSAHGGEWNAD